MINKLTIAFYFQSFISRCEVTKNAESTVRRVRRRKPLLSNRDRCKSRLSM
jgi:hypothetical protein